MNKKIICLLFVSSTAGCHSPSEGAVCPAPEEEVAEPEPEPTPIERTPELEREIEKARRSGREGMRKLFGE